MSAKQAPVKAGTKPAKPAKSKRQRKPKQPKQQSTSMPIAQGKRMGTRAPVITYSKLGGDARITVKHREYIGEVTSAGTSLLFNTQTYALNPGMTASFPWASQIGRNYESYRFRRFKVLFETEQPTTTAGSLMMAIDYDAADTTPTTKVQLMSMHGAQRGPIYAETTLAADASDLHKFGTQRYIRGTTPTSPYDIKTYDAGKIVVASQGVVATGATLGELYFEYEVDFMTPQYHIAEEAVEAVLRSSYWMTVTGTPAEPFLGIIDAQSGVNMLYTEPDNQYLFKSDDTRLHLSVAIARLSGSGALIEPTITASGATLVVNSKLWSAASGGSFIANYLVDGPEGSHIRFDTGGSTDIILLTRVICTPFSGVIVPATAPVPVAATMTTVAPPQNTKWVEVSL